MLMFCSVARKVLIEPGAAVGDVSALRPRLSVPVLLIRPVSLSVQASLKGTVSGRVGACVLGRFPRETDTSPNALY